MRLRLGIVFLLVSAAFAQPPSGLIARSVDLTWTQSTGPGVTANKVYRGTVSGGPYTLIFTCSTACTSYTDTAAPIGTNYYVVTALNSSGESGYSNEAGVVVPVLSYSARTDNCITGSESGCIGGRTTGMAGAPLLYKGADTDPVPFSTLAAGAVMNTCFTDPDFGTYQCLLTDQSTQSATTVFDNGDAGGNNFNRDGTFFMAHNRSGGERFIDIVPSRFKAHTCAPSPSSAKCFVLSQITPGTPNSTHVDNSAVIAIARHNPSLPALTLYEHTGTKISRLTVTQPLDSNGTPTGADTISRTLIYDYIASGLLPADFKVNWTGALEVSDGESFTIGVAGGGSYQALGAGAQTVTTETFILPRNNNPGGTGGNYMFQASAGTTSGIEPNWAASCPAKGSTCSDGTAIWTNIGIVNVQGQGFWVLEYDPATGGTLINSRTGYIKRSAGNPDPSGYMQTDDWLTCDRQANVAVPGTGTRPCRMKDGFTLHEATQRADPNYAVLAGTQGGGNNLTFPGVGSCVDSGMKLKPSTGSGKWSAATSYSFHDLVFGSDGNWYYRKTSLTGTTGDPTIDATNWANGNNLCYGYIHDKHTLMVRPLIGMSAPTGITGGGFSTDAHNVPGYKCTYRGGLYFCHYYSRPTCDAVNNPAGCLYEGAANPGNTLSQTQQCNDSHPTYNQVGALDLEPPFYPHTDVPTWPTSYTCPSYAEETAIANDGSAKEWRYGHNWNTGSSPWFGTQNATGSISQLGDMLAYSSDFMGTRGDSTSGANVCAHKLRGMYQPTPGKTVTYLDTFSFPNGANGSPNVYQVTSCGANTPGATCTLGSPLPDWAGACGTTCTSGTAGLTNLGPNTCRGDIAVMDVTSSHPADVVPLPIASLSPISIGFPNQAIGTTSPAQTATLTNTGAATLNITGVTGVGDFSRTSTCGSTLAIGASCTFSISFTPTVAGTRTGSISISDNAAGSPQVISLSGTGVNPAPIATIAPASLTFSNQPVGTSSAGQTATLSNTGTVSFSISAISTTGDFAQTTSCGATLAAGASCTITVTFTPTAAGTRTGTLSVSDTATGSPQTVVLSGTGTAPAVSLAPALTFASRLVGTTSPAQLVTLSNTGTAVLNIVSSAASGDFSKTTTCGTTLTPGSACTFSVTFTPTAAGTRTGTLTVTDDATGSPHSVSLTGTGIAPAPIASLSPTSLTFASQLVGTSSASQTVTLTNTGTGTLNIASTGTSGDFSRTTTCGATLAVSASCTLTVTFNPTLAGARTGSLTVTDDATGSPQSVSLSGAGIAAVPLASLSPTVLTYASRLEGTSSPAQSVVLTNTGTAILNIASIAATGDFAQSNTCGATLAVSASCTISATFTPTAAGTRTGSISITDNASGSPQSVSLTGVGIAPAPTVSLVPGSLSFATQIVGTTSSDQTVTLTNTGTGTLNIASTNITGDFSATSTCGATVTAGGNCTFLIHFTPTTSGARSGTLSITDDASDSPQTVALSGTGAAAAPQATVSPSSLTFGTQLVGTSSASQTITLSNPGTGTLTLTSIVASGDFSNTTTCGPTLAVSTNCAITVTFTPTVSGARSGAITITDDALSSPQVVSLSGVGKLVVPNTTSMTLKGHVTLKGVTLGNQVGH